MSILLYLFIVGFTVIQCVENVKYYINFKDIFKRKTKKQLLPRSGFLTVVSDEKILLIVKFNLQMLKIQVYVSEYCFSLQQSDVNLFDIS